MQRHKKDRSSNAHWPERTERMPQSAAEEPNHAMQEGLNGHKLASRERTIVGIKWFFQLALPRPHDEDRCPGLGPTRNGDEEGRPAASCSRPRPTCLFSIPSAGALRPHLRGSDLVLILLPVLPVFSLNRPYLSDKFVLFEWNSCLIHAIPPQMVHMA